MAIKRYTADADNTITNAFRASLTSRGTGSNMGAADIVEAFYIYGQVSGSEGVSSEKSRILINFPFATIETDRSASVFPGSGSVSWYLKMTNAAHAFTLPKDFKMTVQPISQSWQEGTGLDMNEYKDQTLGTYTGSNWVEASTEAAWTQQGGDFLETNVATATFDVEVDVTDMVERFLHGSGSLARYGMAIKLSGSYETGSQTYYTKKFYSRSSEFFFRQPVLEARWDSAEKDNAGNFYLSSALAPSDDNINTLYFYNYIRGKLTDIPGLTNNIIDVSLFSGSADNSEPSGTAILLPLGAGVAAAGNTVAVGGKKETGIYTASLSYDSSSITTLFPVWNKSNVQYHTGSSISVKTFNASNINPKNEFVSNITNLKLVYARDEVARFRLYVREKDWCPTVYTKANQDIENYIVEDAYYKFYRVIDNLEVIPYGTGSATSPQVTGSSGSHTRLSYDMSGNYFDLNMDMLESGYSYGIKFTYYVNGSYVEQPEIFKFRVE
jgi:hypothetical protein